MDDADGVTKKYVEDNFATQEDFSAIGILLSLNNIVLLKVVNCNGVPAYGVTASGIKDANGNDIVIGQDGLVNGICTGTTVTFKAIEMADYTYNISSIKGSSQRTTVTLPSIENRIIRYNTTTTISFSGITGKVDVCCVGGGGGGGPVIVDNFNYGNGVSGYMYGGGGGGGGNIVNQYNIIIQPLAPYTLIIGAGGAGSTAKNVRRSGSSTIKIAGGSDGGNTSAFGVIATGGGGATETVAGYQGNLSNANGGSSTNGGKGGNGNCMSASEVYNFTAGTKGEDATGTEFDDGKTYYSGGGGATNKNGGSPYGGNGAYSATTPDPVIRNATGYGGGGNADHRAYSNTSGYTGSGYKGLVAIRLHDATL